MTKASVTSKSDQQQPLVGDLIAAVLAHPDTPSEIYTRLADGLAELATAAQVSEEAPFIQTLIDLYRRKQGDAGKHLNLINPSEN